MNVVYSPDAIGDLEEIYDWNRRERVQPRAAAYIVELMRKMDAIGIEPESGKVVKADAAFRYLVMRRRPRADGHVAGTASEPERRASASCGFATPHGTSSELQVFVMQQHGAA